MWNIKALAFTVQKLQARLTLKFREEDRTTELQNDTQDINNMPPDLWSRGRKKYENVERSFASHVGDKGSIPGRDRPKSWKQVVTNSSIAKRFTTGVSGSFTSTISVTSFAAEWLKLKLLIDIKHCIMQDFKINAQVFIYSLADLKRGHCVKSTFLEGNMGRFFC